MACRKSEKRDKEGDRGSSLYLYEIRDVEGGEDCRVDDEFPKEVVVVGKKLKEKLWLYIRIHPHDTNPLGIYF